MDPIINISFALHSNPGVFALLLGSGVSRAANIPTGWDITLDLIRKVARIEGETADPHPETWYHEKYSITPDYSDLLAKLAKTPSERNLILRSYFEPTEEEIADKKKLPTNAHISIAKLVKMGKIRLIITTNFDRLLEKALEEEGITPDVVSNNDSLLGAVPYIHSHCFILKLHGDYRDIRIKNTDKELARYSKAMNLLLDRMFDEFGLIICGWSGEWDVALYSALMRCKSRRYTTYWLQKGNITDNAQRIIDHRKAEIISIESADVYFDKLYESVLNIAEFDKSHPMSIRDAVASAERYVVAPSQHIKLDKLITQEAKSLKSFILQNQHIPNKDGSTEPIPSILEEYEKQTVMLALIMATICKYGDDIVAKYFKKVIEFLSEIPNRYMVSFYPSFKYYPALIIYYTCGTVLLREGKGGQLKILLSDTKNRANNLSILSHIKVDSVFHGIEHQPSVNHLYEYIKNLLSDYFLDIKEFDETFYLFEFLIGVTFLHIFEKENDDPDYAPIGKFHSKLHLKYDKDNIIGYFIDNSAGYEIKKSLIATGAFDGDLEILQNAIDKYLNILAKTLRLS